MLAFHSSGSVAGRGEPTRAHAVSAEKKHKESHPPLLLAEGIEWRTVDLSSAGTFFSEASIDLLSKHLIGVTDLTLAFDHPRESFVIQRHIGEIAVGYEDAIRLVSPDHPSLDVHGDRRLSNAD
jgi:hypothetical protein